MTTMVQGESFLDGFRRDMQQEGANGLEGEQIARRLHGYLAADCEKLQAPIVDMQQWAMNVEIELKTGAMWTIECLGADAYHFYPAYIRDDGSVVWLNVWVADDLKLDETIKRIRSEIFG